MTDSTAARRYRPTNVTLPTNITGHPSLSLLRGTDGDALLNRSQLIGSLDEDMTVVESGLAVKRSLGSVRYYRTPPKS